MVRPQHCTRICLGDEYVLLHPSAVVRTLRLLGFSLWLVELVWVCPCQCFYDYAFGACASVYREDLRKFSSIHVTLAVSVREIS